MKNIFAISNLEENRCFLCGEELTDANRSNEHVFPRWLQHRVDLWDQSIVLLNQSTIPYRQLTIPCCAECNNGCLAGLESDVGDAFEKGYDAVRSLGTIRLFQWCSKIWYGLLFKELILRADRKDARLGTILTPHALEEFRTHHIFLQSIRLQMHFDGFDPGSVFVVKVHQYDVPLCNFDYFDHMVIVNEDDVSKAQFLAIRCDGVGVICVFEDLGLTKQCLNGGLGYDEHQTLHPLQFVEVGCKIAYQHSLRTFSTRYTTSRVGFTDEYLTTVNAWPTTLWKQANVEHYKEILRTHAGRLLKPTNMFDTPGLVPSFLMKDGKRIVLDRDLRPII